MRPKVSRHIGKVRPSAIAIAQMLAREKGHLLQIHGAEAVRHLGLSTQMQIQPIYYTSGPNQVIRVGNSTVRLVHKPAIQLQHTGTKVGIALTALFYMGKKEGTNPQVVAAIKKQLSPDELHKLSESRMPIWMRKAFASLKSH